MSIKQFEIKPKNESGLPEILAPAGNKDAFLAALAAGADAIYCGLTQFSARMKAKNFSIGELTNLIRLAHNKGTRVYIALNTLLKSDEIETVGALLKTLKEQANPDGIIFQDLAVLEIARQAGFDGELHLSTLANISQPSVLKKIVPKLGVSRVVVPRELSVDEIKLMADACPDGLDLEVFVHGALCYGVSGRCYWSSFLGGKSGLRGRCVQPCRRLYRHKDNKGRFFSCNDLSIDVLVKLLERIPKVRCWKIEGRKKGPHYVYYTVLAYKLLRGHGKDPENKKLAQAILSQALGRESSHYNFLGQRPWNPLNADRPTGSGLLVGKVSGGRQKPYLIPWQELFAGDLLRIGYEDLPGHSIIKITKYVPKKGRYYLKLPSVNFRINRDTPVFLIDRREKDLEKQLQVLQKQLDQFKPAKSNISLFSLKLPKAKQFKPAFKEMILQREFSKNKASALSGIWLEQQSLNKIKKYQNANIWWWLPPVCMPDDEKKNRELVYAAQKLGYHNFMLNSPWQIAWFKEKKDLNLWAGPFCNIANPLAVSVLKSMGFKGVIISPELSKNDYQLLPEQSCLPLGIVIHGNWPLCISRILSDQLSTGCDFASPKNENAWVKKYGNNYWIYPNWKLDLTKERQFLREAGYQQFVSMVEPVPRHVELKKRPGLWNWKIGLR